MTNKQYVLTVRDIDDDRKQVTATVDPHFAVEHGLDPNEQYTRIVTVKQFEAFEDDFNNAADGYERGAALRDFFREADEANAS